MTNEPKLRAALEQLLWKAEDGYATSPLAREAARAALAAPEQATCLHRIADMRNEIVESGYMCLDCGAVFAAADHSTAPSPQQRDESKETK